MWVLGWMPAFLKSAMMLSAVTAFSWACLRTEKNCFFPITMSPLTSPMRLARVLKTAFRGLKTLMSSGWSMYFHTLCKRRALLTDCAAELHRPERALPLTRLKSRPRWTSWTPRYIRS
ncbi:uncharacterized protein LOC144458558 isoform X3 [Epinephelus lanceolatus]